MLVKQALYKPLSVTTQQNVNNGPRDNRNG